MAFDKQKIIRIYQERAKRYDLTANTYYLFGFREFAYRKTAVRALRLKPGDTVVELGCGTGLNFGLLRQGVGAGGRIIGVDLTPAMLDRARQRARRNHWDNIELVQSDAAAYRFPERVDGIISTFALTLVTEYDRVIRNGAAALSSGRRFVILDFKKPGKWPGWLIQTFALMTRPFGVTLDLAERHPWESVQRHMALVDFKELYFGAVYVCFGEAPAPEGMRVGNGQEKSFSPSGDFS